MNLDNLFLKAQAETQKNPISFYDHALGCTHWSKQREITLSAFNNPRTTVPSCHGSGKSYTMGRLALAFLYAYTDSIVMTTAPTFRQVEQIIWRELRGAYASAKIDLGGKILNTKLDLGPNWYAIGMSADKPDAMQGLHAKSGHILIIVDEAAGMAHDLLEAIEGMLTSKHVHLVYIGNPTCGDGLFFDSAKSEYFHKIKISAFDTPNFKINGLKGPRDLEKFKTLKEVEALPLAYPQLVTPAWVWLRQQMWGVDSPMYQARVMANFPEEGEDTLIGLRYVEEALEKKWTDEEKLMRPRNNVLGIDVARFGSDDTSMTAMNNHEMLAHRKFNGKDLMQSCGLAIELFNEMGFEKSMDLIAVDDTGLGGGVTDRLNELGYNVLPINFGTKAETEDEFRNLKAEIYWHMRLLFHKNDVSILDSGNMVSQIPTVRYNYTSNGRLEIVSKKEMKKQGLDSPDDADSLAIALWAVKQGFSTLPDPEEGRGGTVGGNLNRKQF